jgi:hypothetical protein
LLSDREQVASAEEIKQGKERQAQDGEMIALDALK